MKSCLLKHLIIISCMFLVVHVGLIYGLIIVTNFNHAQLSVSSLVTVYFTKDINVCIFLQVMFIFLERFSSMMMSSLLLRLVPQISSHYLVKISLLFRYNHLLGFTQLLHSTLDHLFQILSHKLLWSILKLNWPILKHMLAHNCWPTLHLLYLTVNHSHHISLASHTFHKYYPCQRKCSSLTSYSHQNSTHSSHDHSLQKFDYQTQNLQWQHCVISYSESSSRWWQCLHRWAHLFYHYYKRFHLACCYESRIWCLTQKSKMGSCSSSHCSQCL